MFVSSLRTTKSAAARLDFTIRKDASQQSSLEDKHRVLLKNLASSLSTSSEISLLLNLN